MNQDMLPTIVIGSKQANAFVGSVNGYCSCITSACGMGGRANTNDSLYL